MFLSFCDSAGKALFSIKQNVHPSYSVKLWLCFSVIRKTLMKAIISSDRNSRTNFIMVMRIYIRISFR